MSLLEVRNLSFGYKDGDSERTILKNINMSFEKRKLYAIVGESGSGKTTFLSLLGALVELKNGSIQYNSVDVLEIGLEEYRRKNISFVFQNYNLISYMNAIENIMFSISLKKNPQKIEPSESLEILNKVGINNLCVKKKISQLSGGEQQRVAIARALCKGADIILADEPTGNLDKKTGKEIIKLLKRLCYEEDKCIIIATHSKEIMEEADVVLKLDSKIQNFVIDS